MRVSELWRLTVWMLIPFGGVIAPHSSPAQQPAEPPAASGKGGAEQPSASQQLADEQLLLADRYQQLEMLMLKMAEYDAASQPQRAALLKQALSPRHPEVLARRKRVYARLRRTMASLEENGPDVATAGLSTLRGPRWRGHLRVTEMECAGGWIEGRSDPARAG